MIDEQNPQRVADELFAGFNDHVRFCRESLSIRNLLGVKVPLELWPAQLKLRDAIAKQRAKKKPVRICYLKARRVSVSVAAAAELFHEIPFHPGQHGEIIAHDIDSTKEIFEYIDQFESHYEPFAGKVRLPAAIKDDERVKKWENDSYIKVATANNLKAGRSQSLRFLQLDEFAFWRDARTLMTGLLQSVPEDPGTMILIISTANGVGGPFYEKCQEAMDPGQDSDWIFIFFAWWEHPAYVKPLEIDAATFQKSLGKSDLYGDELAEQAKYSLSLEQLYWRRWSIVNKCQHSVEVFRQEYPGNPLEAFLASGRPRFLLENLGRMNIIRDPMRGRLETYLVGTRERIRFNPQEHGELAIYKTPDINGSYIIGADTATGVDILEGKSLSANPDWSVACVLNANTGEQVAKYRARVEEPEFGEQIDALGRFYNLAYLVPESNSYGRGTIAEIIRRGYPTSLIYQQERETYDRDTTSLNKLGFLTTEVTRPQLISTLDQAIREYSVQIRDENTLSECMTFVKGASGRAEGQAGTHDDEVFALALAVKGLATAPKTNPFRGKPQVPGSVIVSKYRSRRLGGRDTDQED